MLITKWNINKIPVINPALIVWNVWIWHRVLFITAAGIWDSAWQRSMTNAMLIWFLVNCVQEFFHFIYNFSPVHARIRLCKNILLLIEVCHHKDCFRKSWNCLWPTRQGSVAFERAKTHLLLSGTRGRDKTSMHCTLNCQCNDMKRAAYGRLVYYVSAQFHNRHEHVFYIQKKQGFCCLRIWEKCCNMHERIDLSWPYLDWRVWFETAQLASCPSLTLGDPLWWHYRGVNWALTTLRHPEKSPPYSSAKTGDVEQLSCSIYIHVGAIVAP